MQPLFEHSLQLAGFHTRVLELEGDGPPLVLLHGFGDSADTWRRLMVLLGRADRRAIAVDLPGFGAAGPLGRGRVLDQYDEFAAALLVHAADDGGGDPVLIGNSLGGVVSMRAAQDPDNAIASVVGIAPAGLDMPRWFRLIERDPIVRALFALPLPLPEVAVRAAVGEVYRNLAFARPRAMTGDVIGAFTSHHRNRPAVAKLLDTGRRVLPELTDPFNLEQIEQPLMLIWGDRDRMVPHSGARRVLRSLPDTRVEILHGAGHCPQIERADQVADLIDSFVGATATPTR